MFVCCYQHRLITFKERERERERERESGHIKYKKNALKNKMLFTTTAFVLHKVNFIYNTTFSSPVTEEMHTK